MSDIIQEQKDCLNKVDSAMTIVNEYPLTKETNTDLSLKATFNPMHLIMDLFKHTQMYDKMMNSLVQLMTTLLPALEYAAKANLLHNMRVMISCSINPLITEDIILNGVYFDIQKIDLFNTFLHEPLNTIKVPSLESIPGKFTPSYYFDKKDNIDDVKYSDDLNAVLWYAINHPEERVVWRKKDDRDKPFKYNKTGSKKFKQAKSNGIATFEYTVNSAYLKDAVGNDLPSQEPIQRCLHVFIGCTKADPEKTQELRDEIEVINKKITKYNQFIEELNNLKDKIEQNYKELNTITIQNTELYRLNHDLNEIQFNYEYDIDYIDYLINCLTGIKAIDKEDNSTTNILPCENALKLTTDYDGRKPGSKNYIETYLNDVTDENLISERLNYKIKTSTKVEYITIPSELLPKSKKLLAQEKLDLENQLAEKTDKNYPSATSNYYYKKLLMQFNTDMIWNTQLLDPKVIITQLVDALTYGFSCDFDLSYQHRLLQEEIQQMVMNILESDDTTVSDCFFTFSNDDYNEMLKNTELSRFGLRQSNNSILDDTQIQNIVKQLNELSPEATLEEIQSVAEKTLQAVMSTRYIDNPNNANKDEYSLGFDDPLGVYDLVNFIITRMAFVFVSQFFSPKIYMILLLNLKLMGENQEFDLEKAIYTFKNIIKDQIRTIRDQILQHLLDNLKPILDTLKEKVIKLLSNEQYAYYIQLLKQCMECFTIPGVWGVEDWNMDNVQYADIENINEIINTNIEC